MSSIITTILRSTVGLLCDKARDSAANKLKDGDLADEKLREVIVKDLPDIKPKFNCLSLKDLDSSFSFLKEGFSFLKEGIELLNIVLDKSSKGMKTSEGPFNEAASIVNASASGVLNAALSLPQVVERLKISSEERFVSAKDCFKASRESATHAFNNKSLSIKYRIMACKLRVAARILESGLDDPDAATAACLLSLRELHGLPVIQEMFSVFIKGGLKSMLKKAERLENMMSVLSINHVLYDFASKYCTKSPIPLLAWPGIELTGRTFHPILNADDVLSRTTSGGEFVPQLNRVVDSRMLYKNFAVNSRGDIILLTTYKITIIYRTGESKDVMLPEPTESSVAERNGCVMDVAVDSSDNTYVVRRLESCDEIMQEFLLYVFDENYNIKNVSVLHFLTTTDLLHVKIAVDKNQNLYVVTNNWDNLVYVCDNEGKLKLMFKQDERDGYYLLRSLSISNNNDVMIVSHDFSAVQIYTSEGDLKPTIKVPEGHVAWQVAFHHGMCKIIVLTRVWKQDSWFILSYSETGDLESSVFFCKGNPLGDYVNMKSHRSGPVAVRMDETITFI